MINKDKFPINDKQLNENAPRCKGGEMRGRCGDHREKFMEFYRHSQFCRVFYIFIVDKFWEKTVKISV